MSDDDGVTFAVWGGTEWAFLGTHCIGAVRPRAGSVFTAEWISFLCEGEHGRPTQNWRGARDCDAARNALRRHVARWYDAAHTPLLPGQGERLARQMRIG